jgi:multimeric flavodoxin WrbA
MKIVVITSSPHPRGTSALLADEFVRGAREAGHTVFRFDAAFEDVSPCLACDACGMGSERCVQEDGMEKLNPHLLAAELVAFVTPLYYFGMSAQLKTVIDRFYGNNSQLMGGKQAVLLATAYDDEPETMKDLSGHYRTIVKYLKWKDTGMVLATGCGTRGDIEHSVFPAQAYQLGKGVSCEG